MSPGGVTDRRFEFDHTQLFSSSEPVDIAEESYKHTESTCWSQECHDLDPLQVQAGSSCHTSAVLLWSKEADPKFPSTVCTFGSGFSHSGGIGGPRG